MAYKYGIANLLEFLQKPLKEFYSVGLESFRTSKKNFFLQTINIIICGWIFLDIVPRLLFDLGGMETKDLNQSSPLMIVLGLFIVFVISIVVSLMSSVSIGFKTLFETKQELTIFITVLAILTLVFYHFYYKDLKKITKTYLKPLFK